jgi:hypothetical protein
MKRDGGEPGPIDFGPGLSSVALIRGELALANAVAQAERLFMRT